MSILPQMDYPLVNYDQQQQQQLILRNRVTTLISLIMVCRPLKLANGRGAVEFGTVEKSKRLKVSF